MTNKKLLQNIVKTMVVKTQNLHATRHNKIKKRKKKNEQRTILLMIKCNKTETKRKWVSGIDSEKLYDEVFKKFHVLGWREFDDCKRHFVLKKSRVRRRKKNEKEVREKINLKKHEQEKSKTVEGILWCMKNIFSKNSWMIWTKKEDREHILFWHKKDFLKSH